MTAQALVTRIDAGYVHPSRDGRAKELPAGSGMVWRLRIVRKFRCMRCPKTYLNCQDYGLYLPEEAATTIEGLTEGLCTSCIDRLHD